jgi:NAD(P)H-hydrate repair Nnr-like enzyme with NAD(P)H-hydrate dehydratase domain
MNRRVTWWLYYNGAPIAAVRAGERAGEGEVRQLALASFERNPTVYADFPEVVPYEQRARLIRAEVRR